jgi:hypothetical protein
MQSFRPHAFAGLRRQYSTDAEKQGEKLSEQAQSKQEQSEKKGDNSETIIAEKDKQILELQVMHVGS